MHKQNWKWALSLFVLFLGLGTARVLPVTVQTRALSDRVLVLSIAEDTNRNNVVAFKSTAGIVVVDTTMSPSLATAIRKRISAEFGSDDFAYWINTHDHGDHSWGNQVFDDCPGIAHQGCRRILSGADKQLAKAATWVKRLAGVISRLEQKQQALAENSPAKVALKSKIDFYRILHQGLTRFRPTAPAIAFADRMTLNLGDLDLEMTYYGPAHSDNDILILCPQENILLTGDLFVAGMNPHLDSDRLEHLPRWLRVLDQVMAYKDRIRHVVPGHGDFLTVTDLEAKRTFLREQQQAVAGKKPAFREFEKLREQSGLAAALKGMRRLRRKQPGEYFFLEGEWNALGYSLLGEDKAADAVQVLALMVELFPKSFNAYDSLAEACAAAGEVKRAIENYEKSLQLNPENTGALEKIKRLQEKK